VVWDTLQLCGVAMDVCTSFSTTIPLQVSSQAMLFKQLTSRPLTSAERQRLNHSALWFLTGLYQERDPLIPYQPARVVYVCALAMSLLYQPDPSNARMLHSFRRYIGSYRQSLGIIGEVDSQACQLIVMKYFQSIYHHDILFHSQYSVLHSYAEWFNGGRHQYLQKNGVAETLAPMMTDVYGQSFPDNFLEYDQSSEYSTKSRCYQHTRLNHIPIQITVQAHSDDIALFWIDQSNFYSRCVTDLDSLTKILHSRYHCCVHTCRESQNVQRHLIATCRLDDIIKILEWIVSQFVMIKPSAIVSEDRRRLGMARYDDFQSQEHITSINLLYGFQDHPCCNHYHRSNYIDDRVFPEHWFTRSEAIIRPSEAPAHYLPYYHSCHLPFDGQEYSSLINDPPRFAAEIWCNVNSIVEQASNKEQNVNYLSLFVPFIIKLTWLKNQDHLRESIWQERLSYITTMYHIQYYYGQIDRSYIIYPFQPLYVASNAVRSNDTKLNPLQLRRLTVLRDLANTDATKVYVHVRTREIPYQPIIDHLFCPDSITESIGSNIQFFCKSVYLVKDVHVVIGSRFHSFQGSRQYIYDTNQDRYVDSILFIHST
jgi:hypothetical protein